MQREQIFNVVDQIISQSIENDELIKKAIRLVKRAGVPMEKTYLDKYSHYLVSSPSSSSTSTPTTKKELGKTDMNQRRQDVEIRKQWERQHEEKQQEKQHLGTTKSIGTTIASNVEGKSALSRRAARAGTSDGTTKPDIFLPSVLNPDSIATIAYDKSELQKEMDNAAVARDNDNEHDNAVTRNSVLVDASNRVSKIVAQAGSNSNFDGENLGIGGLDDVLRQIRRRVWIPLAAPPQLLDELGIHPGT